MYEVKLPKILFLALLVTQHYKKNRYYNTTDLANLANELAKELVRLRVDKKDYKFLDDTNFGGLRGNFSTALTFRGLVRKGSSITGYYGVGQDDRLMNAVLQGNIILDQSNLSAHTNSVSLRELLQAEARLLTVREEQAHIKLFLEQAGDVKLRRDNVNFPKESVVKSESNAYFLRALVNNYTNHRHVTLEYNLLNYWKGKKYKKFNLHLLVVEPSADNAWHRLYALSSEQLQQHKPLFLRLDLGARACYDRHGNIYELVDLDEALQTFSPQHANIDNRLDYSWEKLREAFCEEEAPEGVVKDDEFSVFLRHFLKWNKEFSIENKDVVDMQVSGSGGPDVRLQFSGGTTQNLELEHKWSNYLAHGHHTNPAWTNCWLYADEGWDPQLVLRLFAEHKKVQGQRVPDVFLCVEDGKPAAYRAHWDESTFEPVPLA